MSGHIAISMIQCARVGVLSLQARGVCIVDIMAGLKRQLDTSPREFDARSSLWKDAAERCILREI